MYAALLIIGTLFGLALALTVGLFYVLSLDGEFKANVRATAAQLRDRITGRKRYVPAVSGERHVEPDNRLRAIQEELRVANRLLDQARNERQGSAEEIRKSSEQTQSLRQDIVERDQRIGALEAELARFGGQLDRQRELLAERGEQLARAQREVRDLTTELDVLHSGANVVNS